MIVCGINNVSKSFGAQEIFQNLTCEVQEGDRIGLVGRNGCGKTTLLKLISGLESPDNGHIHLKKGVKTSYLAQIPSYSKELTVYDVLETAFADLKTIEKNMKKIEAEMANTKDEHQLQKLLESYGEWQEQFIREEGYEIDGKINRIANGLQINPLLEKPFHELSGGERTKAGLALMLLRKPDLLLLDEPTNHLDLRAIEWLSSFLAEYSGTVILISHDRYFLDEAVNKIIELEDGELSVYHCHFSGYVKEKEERLLAEFQAYQEQQKKIKKMKEAIKRLKEWANQANPPNEGLHKRARNMERALERMQKMERPVLERKKIKGEFNSSIRSGNDVAVMEKITMSYSNMLLFKDVDLHIRFKERAAIIGDNGTGKSTLLKIILEQIKPDSGTSRLGSNLKIGYLSQHIFEGGNEKETVLEAFRHEIKVTEEEARHVLARFLFYGQAVFRKVQQLSGGERMRLKLAQLMCMDINFLILDEPTNHLDIESREVLEEALEEYTGTILAVTHDRYFLNRLFRKIYWVENQELHAFDGNYDRAKQKMEETRRQIADHSQKLKQPSTRKNAVEKVKDPEQPHFHQSETIPAIEKNIEMVEKRLSELEGLLRKVSEKPNEVQSLYEEKIEVENQREELYKMLDKLL